MSNTHTHTHTRTADKSDQLSIKQNSLKFSVSAGLCRGEFGLWLDGDLYHGRSNPCKTFGNPRLSQKEDFVLQDIEIWAFE